jgi:uncharacterized Tic20 family protein
MDNGAWLRLPGGNILGPLILWLLKKDTMPLVNAHGKEALNFQITVTAALLLCFSFFAMMFGASYPLTWSAVLIQLIWLVALVLSIIGTVKASNGVLYRYPLTVRLIK